MAAGHIQAVNSPARRLAVIRLLDRARSSYAVRSGGQGYRLKVSFTVNSGGQTKYDGAWEMEDVFDPALGFRWTAQASASYAITRISSHGMLYGEETASYIPLRLQEARAALFDPLPSAENVGRVSFRTSNAVFNGVQLTCVLLAPTQKPVPANPARRWDETEECIDPQSGLLQVHSQVPGRYYAYDYTDAARLGGHELPRKVIVTEAGKTVTQISVDSLTAISGADPSLFAPSEAMRTRGRAIGMAGAQKIWRVADGNSSVRGAKAHTVCVFGVVTPSGELVEAHSLQPSDPDSEEAVEAVKQMDFSGTTSFGPQPQQHFVFVLEKFVSAP